MGRIKDISNASGINIHVTKEFVRDNDAKIVVGELTNWFGDNTGPDWVNLTSLGRFLVNRVYKEINDIISKVEQKA